jgi:hypothetical protein
LGAALAAVPFLALAACTLRALRESIIFAECCGRVWPIGARAELIRGGSRERGAAFVAAQGRGARLMAPEPTPVPANQVRLAPASRQRGRRARAVRHRSGNRCGPRRGIEPADRAPTKTAAGPAQQSTIEWAPADPVQATGCGPTHAGPAPSRLRSVCMTLSAGLGPSDNGVGDGLRVAVVPGVGSRPLPVITRWGSGLGICLWQLRALAR